MNLKVGLAVSQLSLSVLLGDSNNIGALRNPNISPHLQILLVSVYLVRLLPSIAIKGRP
jgi:hypothetical protein